jgi:hypothetical protein
MPAKTDEVVIAQIKAEPEGMSINAIAKKYGVSWITASTIRGHKPAGKSHHRLPPPSTALAKRGEVVEIDPPEEDEIVYVECQIAVPQLDKIYGMLTPHQKATAVLNGLNDEEE